MRLLADDLIAAVATPLGEGAIAIVRVSGRGAIELVEKAFRPKKARGKLSELPSHRMVLGHIVDEEGNAVDEVLVCPMRAPNTYTREDLVEIHCHGGIVSVRRILDIVLGLGARLAEPGEFTKRAFLNGRIDLAQAEAVLDIIRAKSRMGAELALRQLGGSLSQAIGELRRRLQGLLAAVEAGIDFPEDVDVSCEEIMMETGELIGEIERLMGTEEVARIYREGLAVVLLGKPNVGKSTLLNRILGEQRAIVTDIPGTTRDIIEESVSIKGVPVRIIDTAGIRSDPGLIESIGIERARDAVERSDIVVAVFDATQELDEEDKRIAEMLSGKRCVVALNKVDSGVRRTSTRDLREMLGASVPIVEISAKEGIGIESLEERIVEAVSGSGCIAEGAVITRRRHKEALKRACQSLEAARKGLADGVPMECVAVDLWEAWERLGEITGESLSEEVIDRIFEEFCVGK